jgi:hypothetical protein
LFGFNLIWFFFWLYSRLGFGEAMLTEFIDRGGGESGGASEDSALGYVEVWVMFVGLEEEEAGGWGNVLRVGGCGFEEAVGAAVAGLLLC